MPADKPQYLKSPVTVEQQPKKHTSRIQNILYLDLGGLSGNEISQRVGITPMRVSIIRNSPMYLSRRTVLAEQLKEQILDKQSDKIVEGDPVDDKLKQAALAAAEEKIELMKMAESEQVRNSAATDILAYSGYKAKGETRTTVIEIDADTAKNWQRAMTYEYDPTKRKGSIKISQEVFE